MFGNAVAQTMRLQKTLRVITEHEKVFEKLLKYSDEIAKQSDKAEKCFELLTQNKNLYEKFGITRKDLIFISLLTRV